MIIPIGTAAAAEKQIDQIQNLLNAIILAAVLIILADAAADKNVSFLGLKTETSGAFGIAACAFFLAILMIAQLFARLADMVALADGEEAPKLIAALFNHRWSFNPFSYFGSRPVAMLHASCGMGLLAVFWWLGLLALSQLWHRMSSGGGLWEIGLWYCYLGAGAIALIAVLHVQRVIDARLAALAQASEDAALGQTRQDVRRAFIVKCVTGIALAAFGYWIFNALTHIGA
jgi:hypothetical protein